MSAPIVQHVRSVFKWWATNGSKFPAWAEAAQIIFAFTPNSAAAERVFSMLKSMFGDQQMETLADIIQTALINAPHQRAPRGLSEHSMIGNSTRI